VALAGCRRQVAPTLVPTMTATPRSTPLPAVATDVPPGAAGNPIQLVIRPETTESTAKASATVVEDALRKQTGLEIQVVLVTRYAEALGALCDSNTDKAAIAWMDGITYAAAYAQKCGSAALEVERGTGRSAETGSVVQIVASKKADFTGMGGLKGSKFCRAGYEDTDTWLIPSLMMQASNVRPLYDLGSVTDYDDVTALLEAVASGKCEAAGVPKAAVDDADADTRDAVNVVASSAELPYAVMLMPDDLALGVRDSLLDAFDSVTSDTTTARALKDLIGQDALKRVTDDDFSDVRDFVASAKVDLTKLGS
jgi:ABC-type phosphate/phosphonate transport system substrate-binding protein